MVSVRVQLFMTVWQSTRHLKIQHCDRNLCLFQLLAVDSVEPLWDNHSTSIRHSKKDLQELIDFIEPARNKTFSTPWWIHASKNSMCSGGKMLNTDGHRVYVQTHCGECRGRIVSYMETVDQYHSSYTERCHRRSKQGSNCKHSESVRRGWVGG